MDTIIIIITINITIVMTTNVSVGELFSRLLLPRRQNMICACKRRTIEPY
jgi:hypothetical protein